MVRRITVSLVFAIAVFLSLALTPSLVSRLDKKVLGVSNCTYNVTEIKCGNYYISSSNKIDVLAFGQSVIVNKNDIAEIMQELDVEIVEINKIDTDCTLYVLYSNSLPKYRILKNQKYNLQICVKGNVAKIGYPAIYDSF